MKFTVRRIVAASISVRRRLVTAVVAVCVMAAPTFASATDPVLEWNDIARALIVVPAFAPVQQTRAMAIVHVAMHDAVSAVTGTYEQYRPTSAAPAGASAEAAAIAAAYRVLRGIFGDSAILAAQLAAQYSASLVTHGVSLSDPGLAFGESIGEAILVLRQDDGASLAGYPYLPPGAGTIGVWSPISSVPAAQALLPGWGDVQPWVLRSGSQFRPDGPPALDSERYAEDYNEIVQIGKNDSATRTNEQTQIALFWRASPTAVWNGVMQDAVQSRDLDIAATARVTALFYLAAADASVACWDSKYVYNFWRPQAAIVNGDIDGNAATVGNPLWLPLVPTPPHPEYTSGHSTNSSAMVFVLESMFGDAPGYVIDAVSPQNVGFVRHWEKFSEGIEEVIDARIYSGIHFRTADEVGARLGRQVAQFVMTHALRPVKGGLGRQR